MAPPPPPPPPDLMDELIEEFLLRLPPDDPASLARAALVCRRWRRIISSPCFRRRLRGLHSPPMLGFLRYIAEATIVSRFVPTSSFRPPRADRRDMQAIDSRHGHVLLCSDRCPEGPWENGFLVWDPVTDVDQEVPAPPRCRKYWKWNATVLCAAARGGGCSHIDCRGQPFLVFFLCASGGKTFACVYSSEAGVWSEHAYDDERALRFTLWPAVLMDGALHVLSYQLFQQDAMYMIFKYDLATSGMSEIDVPDGLRVQEIVMPMSTEDGRLGLTFVEDSRLYLWAREADSQGVGGWAVSRVIELELLLPADALSESPQVYGFAECAGVIFLWTVNGFYAIDLKSDQARKVGEYNDTVSLVPYESFCLPALGATSACEGPEAAV
ncbi:unnamed protein product [Urochloa decumbens]|uniref:F-box domain-containing protein n=1 Tax=Urochloa decumbens TaxID=240449 RepID=A0ABC9DA60_9POAL